MTAGNIYNIQLVLLNGLVPFVWFLLRESTTGAGLTTGTQITSFEWRNSHNTSLQNGVLTRDAIAWYEYGSREFNSVFFQNNYAYPTCWVPRPMELGSDLIILSRCSMAMALASASPYFFTLKHLEHLLPSASFHLAS